jgi:transcriptional/translational regulatory protein YebC/TACO1
MFNQQGVISIEAGKRDPDDLALELLDAVDVGDDGDVGVDGDEVVVTVAPSRFETVKKTLEERNYAVDNAEVTMNPTTSVVLDASQARQVLRLLDGLEDHDDVQQVYANAEIPDDVLESLESVG